MTETDTQAVQVEQVRVPGKRADGRKTTVSWPALIHAQLIERCGGRQNFRPLVNVAMKTVTPKLGYAYSFQVRQLTEQLVNERYPINA